MESNPFTLGFGKTPHTFISRASETQNVIEDFNSDLPASQSYLITWGAWFGKNSDHDGYR